MSLQQGASASKKNVYGETPLHIVCFKENKLINRAYIIQKLIFLSGNPSPKNHFKVTPLHIVCSKGRHRLVKILVNCNASLRVLNGKGNQPLQSMLSVNISLGKKCTIARILLDKASDVFKREKGLANRYVTLARKISMKYKVRIPRKYKRRFCKHCYHYLVPSKTCRVRLIKHKVVYYCLNCKKFMRFPYNKKKKR